MTYEGRIKLLRVENYLFAFWADAMARGDLFWEFGFEVACRQVRALRLGDRANANLGEIVVPRLGSAGPK